jgi:hypothetical protein
MSETATEYQLYITPGERDLLKRLLAQGKIRQDDLAVYASGEKSRSEFRHWLDGIVGKVPSREESDLVDELFDGIADRP